MRWDWRQLIELRLWLAPSCCCCERWWWWVSAGSCRLCLLADMIALPAGKTLINCYHHLFISACSRFSFPVWTHHHVSFCPVFCHSRRCLHILCFCARRRAVLPVDVSVSPSLSASLLLVLLSWCLVFHLFLFSFSVKFLRSRAAVAGWFAGFTVSRTCVSLHTVDWEWSWRLSILLFRLHLSLELL